MDALGNAIYQYTPPSPEEQEKRRRLDAAFAAGAAMLAASGGNRNFGQALGAGGLAAANARYNSNAAARDEMQAGYQMEQLQRQNAQARQLEQVLPELIKAEFSRDAIAGAAQKAPAAALGILDMADKRNKAKLEQTKTEAQIQNERLKVAEKFAEQGELLRQAGRSGHAEDGADLCRGAGEERRVRAFSVSCRSNRGAIRRKRRATSPRWRACSTTSRTE